MHFHNLFSRKLSSVSIWVCANRNRGGEERQWGRISDQLDPNMTGWKREVCGPPALGEASSFFVLNFLADISIFKHINLITICYGRHIMCNNNTYFVLGKTLDH